MNVVRRYSSGLANFFIASALRTNGRTPSPEILKPSHSMSDLKNAHFPHLTAMLFVSNMIKLDTLLICVLPRIHARLPGCHLCNNL